MYETLKSFGVQTGYDALKQVGIDGDAGVGQKALTGEGLNASPVMDYVKNTEYTMRQNMGRGFSSTKSPLKK